MKLKTSGLVHSWPFLLGLAAGLYILVFNTIGFDFAYFPGDFGDARFNNYILEHGHKFLTGQEPSFWNAPFMYPEAEVVTYSDNLIGTVPIYSIFRILGYDLETAFQFWFLILSVLNYACAYYFLRWTLKNRYAAVLGAFIFAFSLALQSQMTHAQVFPRFFIPLAMWMLLLFKNELKPRHLFAAILYLVLQFYSGIYLGFMLLVPFSLVFIFILIYRRKQILIELKKWKWTIQIVLGLVINATLLLLLMLPYYHRSKLVGKNSYDSISSSIPTIKSYFFSQPGSVLWDKLSYTGSSYPAYWDHQIFPGGMVILAVLFLCILISFYKRWKIVSEAFNSTVWMLILSGGLTFLFFTRYQGFSFYKILYSLPGFASMRSLTRIINVELLFFGIIIALVAKILLKKYAKYSIPIFIIMFSLIVVDNYFKEGSSYRAEKKIAQSRVNQLKTKMKGIPEGSLISYEPAVKEDFEIFYQLDAMLAAQALNLKSVNGYSGTSPIGFNEYWWGLDETSRAQWFNVKMFEPDTLFIIN